MQILADKVQENKSPSVANVVTQQRMSDNTPFEFSDDRPEAIAQRQLQEMANNSPKAIQLKAYQVMADHYTSKTVQRKENLEEENIQGKFETMQRFEKDEPSQGRFDVVQQAQGRVSPTMQLKGTVNIKDDDGLENETIQLARPVTDILTAIDNNAAALGTVSGSQTRRLMYWNSMHRFDVATGGNLNAKTLKKAMSKKMPIEEQAVVENALPEFMQIRSEFSADLPAYFGGGKIWFRKRVENNIFQGRAWISDNIYWRSPAVAQAQGVAAIPRVPYMIHAILEWAGQIGAAAEPTPHITLRNAETQVNMDLDTTNPLPHNQSRILAPLEVTRASFSQGLGVNREPGVNMVPNEPVFANLTAQDMQQWLTGLIVSAQAART